MNNFYSWARRPIYLGRRSNRYKCAVTVKETLASDEGNTSEYSNPPSSKSSTLESKPDRTRTPPSFSTKRLNECSDASSDSESEENLTVATQVCYDVNKIESIV